MTIGIAGLIQCRAMSITYADTAATLTSLLGPVRFVAVSFLSAPPEGITKFTGTTPSSCSFWRLASEGAAFYTEPSDHFNCPVGSYTQAIDLPASRGGELEQVLTLMSKIGYVRMEEVPSIPRLPRAPAFIYYAPLAAATIAPDVIIAAGRPSSLMRLQEAAAGAGAASALPLLGRPTCMALPAAMAHGSVMSSGCIGNRVYTDLGDDELYVMIPGSRIDEIVRQLAVVHAANDTLRAYHTDRRATLSS
jgi:uncharacterized protein (DUF169 family)